LCVLTWLAAGVLLLLFLSRTRGEPVPAASTMGRWYGLAGAVLLLFLTLYGIRRVVFMARLGSLETWYRAHLLLGVLALVLLGCHSGFGVRSLFLGALQLSFWGSVLTGAVGWGYQTALTRWMVRHEYRPTILRELDATRDALARRLEEALEAERAPLRAEAERVDRMRRRHYWLRSWTTVHLLFAAAAAQLMIWHIWSVALHPR
jgi:hypothetical protein